RTHPSRRPTTCCRGSGRRSSANGAAAARGARASPALTAIAAAGDGRHRPPLRAHLGWGTILMYGRGAFQPSGYVFFASSSETEPAMITSWPCFQFTGVATLCLVVSWQEPRSRRTSSKLPRVDVG